MDAEVFDPPEGYTPDYGPFRETIAQMLDFAPEEACESVPGRLEIVSYTVVWRQRDEGGTEVFVGQRLSGAGEERLHDNHLVGWGGHAEIQDTSAVDDILSRTALRELYEELYISTSQESTLRYHGIVYDPSNEVGKDHIGVVHSMCVSSARVREEEKYAGKGFWLVRDGGLAPPVNDTDYAEVLRDDLWGGWESWSAELILGDFFRDEIGGGDE